MQAVRQFHGKVQFPPRCGEAIGHGIALQGQHRQVGQLTQFGWKRPGEMVVVQMQLLGGPLLSGGPCASFLIAEQTAPGVGVGHDGPHTHHCVGRRAVGTPGGDNPIDLAIRQAVAEQDPQGRYGGIEFAFLTAFPPRALFVSNFRERRTNGTTRSFAENRT